MLGDTWLLTDLDGTLVSTPHKAHGQYQSLDKSPCFPAVKQWLLNGGSVCIVTTADKRVFDQVYAPLRSILKGADGRGSCGELLLSLYTGAVLYRCTADGVELVREYAAATHCATHEAVELAHLYGLPLTHVSVQEAGPDGTARQVMAACVERTCFSMAACRGLLGRIEEVFISLLEKVLRGDPVFLEALGHLSARYQKMWRLLLGYLEARYRNHGPSSASAADTVAWKLDFLRLRRRLLTELGVIRVELAEPQATMETGAGDECSRQQQARARVLGVLGDDGEASRAFAQGMMRLLGPRLQDAHGDCPNGSMQVTPGTGDVAQVIVVGVPICLFACLFQPQLRSFAGLGVTAIPQPNSVVFSKMGVCKSTVIRYLIGQHRVNHRRDSHRGDQGGSVFPMHGAVDLARAVALGDNPHTTDYELTVFAGLPFISVEIAEQRRRRHALICEEGLVQTVPRRGLLMDDRKLRNLFYVGGEESGSAVFLTELMDRLRVPAVGRVQGEALTSLVEPACFASAVATAAKVSFTKMDVTPSHV